MGQKNEEGNHSFNRFIFSNLFSLVQQKWKHRLLALSVHIIAPLFRAVHFFLLKNQKDYAFLADKEKRFLPKTRQTKTDWHARLAWFNY